MPIRVAAIDDDQIVLDALELFFADTDEVTCVGCYSSASEALAALPRARPDVVLVDIRMPRMTGIECTTRLKLLMPDVQVIMLTALGDRQNLIQSLLAGASGYLVKPVSPSECLAAVKDVFQGGAPLSREVTRLLVDSFHCCRNPGIGKPFLSARERQIMAYLIEGCPDREIAKALHIGRGTVHTHLQRMFGKLDAHSRAEAITKYLDTPVAADVRRL